jgi:hypothetical protein
MQKSVSLRAARLLDEAPPGSKPHIMITSPDEGSVGLIARRDQERQFAIDFFPGCSGNGGMVALAIQGDKIIIIDSIALFIDCPVRL